MSRFMYDADEWFRCCTRYPAWDLKLSSQEGAMVPGTAVATNVEQCRTNRLMHLTHGLPEEPCVSLGSFIRSTLSPVLA